VGGLPELADPDGEGVRDTIWTDAAFERGAVLAKVSAAVDVSAGVGHVVVVRRERVKNK